MGVFKTQAILAGDPAMIPAIADQIEADFAADGYSVQKINLMNGAADVSLTKGGTFKAILGLKTALNISLKPQNGQISFEAGVGIFGQQFIPTAIMWYVAWPVLLTQIWGLVQQAKLDDRALQIAKNVIRSQPASSPQANAVSNAYCASCGAKLPPHSKFCPSCGAQIV